MRFSGHRLVFVLAMLVAARPASAQSLQLTGIGSFWSTSNGTFSSAPWTTDRTPTPHNWFGIWVSTTPGGAFLPGVSQSNLGYLVGSGTNDLYAVLDAAPEHAGTSAYRAFSLFFNNEIAPRISIVTPTAAYDSYAAIGSSVLVPRLRYETGGFVNASGVTSFTQDGFVYSLTGFDARMGTDRVYADQPVTDGYTDPEFHFRVTVTSVVPEPSTAILTAVGSLALIALRRRRTSIAADTP